MSVESFPEIYHQTNSMQTEFSSIALDKVKGLFLDKAQATENLRLIDIGCGDGKVLKEIFMENCGLTFSEVVGTDKSIDMVKFAREKYGNEKLNFHVLDIETANLDDNFGTFDIATSYFVFHWVKDYKQAIKNVHKLLKPGGIFHFYLIGDSSVTQLFAPLVKKYKSMEKSIFDITYPLAENANFMENFKKILEENGFNIEFSEINKIYYDFETAEKLLHTIIYASPFFKQINDDVREEFINDLLEMQLSKSKALGLKPYQIHYEAPHFFLTRK